MNQNLLDPAAVFRQEASEILEQLETVLLDLERKPDDRALLDAAFRAMHTLKGSGAMFGFDRVAAFMHGFETTFDLVRKGKIKASPAIVAVSLKARDFVRGLIEDAEPPSEEQGREILAELERVASGAPDAAQSPPVASAPTAGANDGSRIRFRFKGPLLANGTNPLRLIDEIRQLGPCTVRALAEGLPALEDIDPEVCYVGWEIDLPASVSKQDIENVFMFVIDDMDLVFEALQPAAAPAAVAAPSTTAAPAQTAVAPPELPAAQIQAQRRRRLPYRRNHRLRANGAHRRYEWDRSRNGDGCHARWRSD